MLPRHWGGREEREEGEKEGGREGRPRCRLELRVFLSSTVRRTSGAPNRRILLGRQQEA